MSGMFACSEQNSSRIQETVGMMGVENGIGFAPFGGPAYEVFQRINKDDRTPARV